MKVISGHLLLLLVLVPVHAFQWRDVQNGFEENRLHSCVHYELNSVTSADNLDYFYSALDHYVARPAGKITIVHIGDSHIQADYLTQETRTLFQKTFGNGGRGYVFPYRVIRTNGSPNCGVSFAGEWSGCRSVIQSSECNFGITGASATTYDTLAKLVLNPNLKGDMNYEFNRVKFFHNRSPQSMQMVFKDAQGNRIEVDEQPVSHSVTDVYFSKYQDSLMMEFKPGMDNGFYQLFGMSFENDHPGIIYHSVGLNGAYVQSFLRNQFFVEQLAALNPDLIIISLGTNDGYMPDSRFCRFCFTNSYRELLNRVRDAHPGASILLTTPGDYYRRKRYHNQNNDHVIESIYKLSEEFKTAVWDFNKVMGGNHSVRKWVYAGLARQDLIHFTKEGYQLQGELLYKAIMQGYESRFE